MSDVSTVKKRRGVVRASITRLATKLRDLKEMTDQPMTPDLVQAMTQKLNTLDAEFRKYHFELIDLIDDEETLAKEQETLDSHDDNVSALSTQMKQLMMACFSADSSKRKISSKKLSRLENNITSMRNTIDSFDGPPDVCLLQQHEEQLRDFKAELGKVSSDLIAMDLDDADELYHAQSRLEKEAFSCDLKIKKLLASTTSVSASSIPATSTPDSAEGSGVKLPRLDVPTFDGQVINWISFWEQFDISIHRRTNLSNTEKLVYLKQSLKDGTAKGVIEGLSKSGEHYEEAIKSLKARYDRPRLIHQTHVRMILEATSLKEGTGKELRRLHDTVQQHLRALRAMDYEPSGLFIMSVLELKLDTNTMFEWQKFSQDSPKVPHYQDLLEFLNLRAQASESSLATTKKGAAVDHQQKTLPRQITSFAASASTNSESTCILCKTEKHPLFACHQFKAMSHDKKISTLKSQDLCLNCLRPGHFVKQCKSLHRCRRCQNPHHTLLHVDRKEQNTLPAAPAPTPVTNVSANVTTPGLSSHSLLMTCHVLVRAPDGGLLLYLVHFLTLDPRLHLCLSV